LTRFLRSSDGIAGVICANAARNAEAQQVDTRHTERRHGAHIK